MSPTFSVLITSYNSADTIERCLKSVLSQVFLDFEVIVVDDGSSDKSVSLIKKFEDPRIRLVSLRRNSGGPALPRNTALDLAKGTWVCFLDSDDWWSPLKLSTINSFSSPSIDVLCHNENRVDREERKIGTAIYGPCNPMFYQTMLVSGNRLSTSATTVRRSFINDFDLRFDEAKGIRIVEDFDFWLKLAREGAKFRFVDEVLGNYVIEGGISCNLEAASKNLNNMLRRHIKYCGERENLRWLAYLLTIKCEGFRRDDLNAYKSIACSKKIEWIFRGIVFYIFVRMKRVARVFAFKFSNGIKNVHHT